MKRVISRFISIIPALLLQIFWYSILIGFFSEYRVVLETILRIYSIIVVFYLELKREEPTYKVIWLIVIFIFPILGSWLYFCYGNDKTARNLNHKLIASKKKIKFDKNTDKNLTKNLEEENKRYAQIMEYISTKSNLPIRYTENVKYYPIGEKMYVDILEDLSKAKKFVYMEFFIIANGIFWDSIVNILKSKVKEGVDVRVLYDDIGSMATYGKADLKKIRKLGIKCEPFNSLNFIKGQLNNRDHRKMVIIDDEIVFSGGINIGDEYINIIHRFGHWKDIGFRITGEPVKNYTYMFMEFWNAFSINKIKLDLKNEELENEKTVTSDILISSNNKKIEYKNNLIGNDINKINSKNNLLKTNNSKLDSARKNGYILSYYDSTTNKEALSNNLYIELLEVAKDYMYFYTPYLVLGDDLKKTIIRTAERGVDIKIIIPGIPDKKIVYRLAKSYFNELIESGVEIYTYTPGFIHAKATLSDDEICTIGTVNLDYRSLFLHFENNSIFYKSDVINDLKEDFLETLKKCKKVKKKNKILINYFIDALLRLASPLL